MKVASWNVNSIKVRLEHLTDWLADQAPDVLGLQEIKTVEENFPFDAIRETGYECSVLGQKTYNGVALLSPHKAEDIQLGMPGLDDPQARVIAGTFNGTRVINLYVPNGQAVGSEKYAYKLNWLDCLHTWVADELKRHDQVVVMGDFNIAPDDRDVHDPEEWTGKILCSDEERSRLNGLLDLGLHDSFRLFDQEEAAFSWWDYRAAGFRRNRGLRIDLLLVSDAVRESCTASIIDKEPRKLERPSDHAPVMVTFGAD